MEAVEAGEDRATTVAAAKAGETASEAVITGAWGRECRSNTGQLAAPAICFASGGERRGMPRTHLVRYSGDWSRIGAISKDTEELLKLGAYAVVPLCVAFVFLPSSQDSSDVES
uniref:DUF7887 domain-containing protein n=1 Tax=Oryza brachyantha TaxID=4533 RepID=J3LLB2_ORYBR